MTLSERRARLFAEMMGVLLIETCIPEISERQYHGRDCWAVWVEDDLFVAFEGDDVCQGFKIDWEVRDMTKVTLNEMERIGDLIRYFGNTLRAVLEQLPDEEMEE